MFVGRNWAVDHAGHEQQSITTQPSCPLERPFVKLDRFLTNSRIITRGIKRPAHTASERLDDESGRIDLVADLFAVRLTAGYGNFALRGDAELDTFEAGRCRFLQGGFHRMFIGQTIFEAPVAYGLNHGEAVHFKSIEKMMGKRF